MLAGGTGQTIVKIHWQSAATSNSPWPRPLPPPLCRRYDPTGAQLPALLGQGAAGSGIIQRCGARGFRGRCRSLICPSRGSSISAHIVMDADEQLGQPIVSNGLPLTKLHHAAFDAHLIGVDPDFRIHVSDRLIDLHDGPFLELGIKGIAGTSIQLPRRNEDRPDRDRLALRFEQFTKAA
jgi:hypothetical protein